MDADRMVHNNYKLKRKETVKRFMFGLTFTFLLIRMDYAKTPDSEMIVIMPSYTYIPRKIFRIVKNFLTTNEEWKDKKMSDKSIVDKIMTEFDSEYTFKSELLEDYYSNNLFKSARWRENHQVPMNDMMIYRTEVDWYLSFTSTEFNNKKSFRFWPYRDEKNILFEAKTKYDNFNTPLGKVKRFSSISEMMSMTDRAYLSLDNLCNVYFNRKKKFKKKEELFKVNEDYITTITNMMTGELDMKKVDYFNRARHEVFFKVVIEMIDEDPPDQSDVDITQVFNYTGPKYYQTPDYIYRLEDRIILLDLAVTGTDPGKIRDNKVKKYTDLALNLETHLNQSVESEAVVWKINSFKNFYLPSFLDLSEDKLWSDHRIQALRKIYKELETKPMFEFYKKTLLEEKDEDDFQEILEMVSQEMSNLVENKLMCLNLDVRSVDISRSRDNMDFWKRLTLPKVKPEDMEYFKEIEKTMTQTNETYIYNISKLYTNMMDTNRMPKYQESFIEFNLDMMKKISNKMLIKYSDIRSKYLENGDMKRKVPKFFSFPMMKKSVQLSKSENLNSSGGYFLDYSEMLADGTMLVRGDLDFKLQKAKEEDKKEEEDYAEEGIGINIEEDASLMEDMIEMMMEPDLMELDDKFGSWPMDESLANLYSSKLFKLVSFVSELAENLCYLEGRRYYRVDKNNKKSKGYTVAKNYGSYLLIVKSGSRLTKEKQVRYKLVTHSKNLMSYNFDIFKTMTRTNSNPALMESNWLTMSIPLMKHFLKMKETTVTLFSSLRDKYKEENRGIITEPYKMNKTFCTMVLAMLECRRGLSTTLQLDRYLLHSATSYITNRPSLLKEILKEPIRGRMEAYHRVRQMNWYMKMLQDSKEIWMDRISNSLSNDTDYDRFYTWSPFDLNKKIEFTTMMDCIYSCNLFEKSAGFTDHRVKAILSKMVAAEKHFLSVKDSDESKGLINNVIKFWNSEDELHKFDARWIISMTKMFFKRKVNRLELMLAIDEAMSETINDAMMMTSSLKSGPIYSKNIKHSKNVEKTMSFLSIFDEISDLSTNCLFEIVANYKEVEAIFSLFPKAQIGGPREILIQSVRLRLMVKFLEMLSEKMCKLHPKEMLTKDNFKSQIQSDSMNEIREKQQDLTRKNINSVAFSFNMDATKWSPGFVMEQFFVMVMSMPIPKKIKDVLLSVISSFSSKFMFTPEALKRKWMNKDVNEKESRDDLEWFRQKAMNQQMTVEILSGMGQGMLHRMSSFMGCLADDANDIAIEEVMKSKFNISIDSKTLISSDDKTKMVLMYGLLDNNDLVKCLEMYAKALDSFTRLANIHINWKKSTMNFVICEFNSLFSVGKRMSWALIKDIYNLYNTPDLTWPEAAVQEMMSNMRRVLEHGMYKTSIDVSAKMMNMMLRRYYKLDRYMVEELMMKLKTTEDRLPFHLGFFPTTNMFSKLIMGKEIQMYSKSNSKELVSFYKKMYSAKRFDNNKDMKNYIPFDEDSRGRYWMKIEMKVDKKLKKMKDDFFDKGLMMKPEDLMVDLNKNSMNICLEKLDIKSYSLFCKKYFLGMKSSYEFSDSMPVHSLVRCLQYSSGRATIMPKNKETMMMEDELKNIEEKLKMKEWFYEDNWEKTINEKIDLEAKMANQKVDVLKFVDHVIKNGSEDNTMYDLYIGLKDLEDYEENTTNESESFPKSFKFPHSSFRKMRFYISPLGMNTSPIEILRHLFEEKYPTSNRLLDTIDKLFYNNFVPKYDTKINKYLNPFLMVKNLMKMSSTPFKDFSDYMTTFLKNLKFTEVNMISDSSCSGNYKDNLKKLILTKTNPDYMMILPSSSKLVSEDDLGFLTNISLARYDNIDKTLNKEMMVLTSSDTKLERAKKMYKITRFMNKNELTMDNVMSDRVEYSKKKSVDKTTSIHFWTDYFVNIISLEKEETVLSYIFASDDLDSDDVSNRKIFSIYDRFKIEMTLKRKTVNLYTLREWSTKYMIPYTKMKFVMKTQIQRLYSKWRMMLFFLPMADSSLCNQGDFSFTSLCLFEDDYTVDYDTFINWKMDLDSEEIYTMRNMMIDVPDLLTLDQVFNKYDLMPEFNMPFEGTDISSDQKYSVENILKQFNESLSSTGYLTKITSLFGTNVMRDIEEDNDPYRMYDTNSDHGVAEELEGMMDVMDEFDISQSGETSQRHADNDNTLVSGLMAMKERFETEDKANKKPDDFIEVVGEDNMREMKKIKVMDSVNNLVKRSFDTCMDIDKFKMRRMFNSFRSNGSEDKFHNLLLFQVNMCFDFQLSDSMSVFLYNYCLSKMSGMYIINPTYKLKKFGPEKMTLLNDETIFMKNKEDNEEMYVELMDKF